MPSQTTYDLDALPKSLLTTGNPKTAKGEGSGYLTAILHLAPAMLSGRNVCPHASKGCIAACLNTAGHGGIGLDADGLNIIQAARIRRTRWFQRDRGAFMRALADEIRAHVKRAELHGLTPCVRLNGTSDLPWERFAIGDYANIFAMFPHVQFYDYTKWPLNKRDVQDIRNYHLTFSYSERDDAAERAVSYLTAGYGVAMVFDTRKSADLPAFWTLNDGTTVAIAQVIDGDTTDLRFTDPGACIVGLRAKGRAKHDTSGFVVKA